MESYRPVEGARGSFAWFCRNVGASVLFAFSTSGSERPKFVLSHALSIALLRCCIHLLPIGVIAYLIYLNTSGYFIGDQLIGGAGSSARNLLLIQLAAKVLELLVVASLTSVVVNWIRHRALQKGGVPFGLLSAGFRFASLSYLWSPAYILGCLSPGPWSKRALTALLVAVCGLLAVTVGPSSALLMIPARQSSWYAGGTDFWLVGTNDTLWPDQLNANNVGGSECLAPSVDNLTNSLLSTSGCIWHGYSQLSEGLKDRHFDWQGNLTFNDGVIKRQFTRSQAIATGSETWTFGPHVATARISRLLADEWYAATINASSARAHEVHATLKNATAGLGIASVDSWLPVCRVACTNYPDIGSLLSWNLDVFKLPEYSPVNRTSQDGQITMAVDFPDTTNISTQWMDVPAPTSDNHLTAALMIRIPYQISHNEVYSAAAFGCSIDARWAQGTNIGTGLPVTDNMIVSGRIHATRAPSNLANLATSYLPAPGPDWRFASATSDWLTTLIPPLNSNNTGNYTTLADAFKGAGFDNSTGIVSGSFASLGATIESTIATWFVDGMSRVGLSANGGNMQSVMPGRYDWLTFLPERQTDSAAYYNRILEGQTVVVPPPSVASSDLTKLSWTVTVAGLAYKADSVSAWVAISVLLIYVTIAGSQVFYMLVTRRSSDAWESLEELLILMLQSKPSKSTRVQNTSAGIWQGGVMQLKTKIVVRDEDEWKDGKEVIQVLLDPDSRLESRSSQVEPDKAYGASVNASNTTIWRSKPYRDRNDQEEESIELVSNTFHKALDRPYYRI